MNIPNLLHDHIGVADLTNSKGEITQVKVHLSEPWKYLLGQLIQQLQSNVSNEGFVIPSQNNEHISTIAPNAKNGTFIYNDETHEMKVKINGVIKTVTVS